MDVGNSVLIVMGKKKKTTFNTFWWVALTRKWERVCISAKYFSWKFLCKQGLNWCLKIVEKNVSLAIVLELQNVQENDDVTYSTKVISRHKKENSTFILFHTFLGSAVEELNLSRF